MKKICYIAALLSVTSVTEAQPTINHMFDYSVGDSSKRMICDNAGLEPGAAGGNQQWIFTNLQVTDSLNEKVVAPSNTPFASSFPTATFALKNDQGGYTYFQQTATESQMLGFADSFSSYMVVYNDPVLRAQRPFTYGNTVTDTFWTVGQNFTHGNLEMTADAWGTLQLPDGSYNNVLRIKSVYYEFDSMNSGSSPIISDLAATTYSWFNDAYSTPLLIWDSTHILNSIGDFSVKTVSYLKSSTTTAIKNINHSLQLSAFMQQGQLHIIGIPDADKTYNIQLIGIDGKKVTIFDRVHGAERIALPISTAVSPGTYLLFVSDNVGNFGTAKLSL